MIIERKYDYGNDNVSIREVAEYARPNIAHFPTLSVQVIHGFSWGEGIQNYSYAKEPGFPNKKSINLVRNRVDVFLRNLGLNLTDKTIVLQAPVENSNITDIDDDFFAKHKATIQGTFAEAGAIFTTLKDTTFTVPPGDCRWAIVYATTSSGEGVLGFIHLARELLDTHFLEKALIHLKQKYGVEIRDIKVGITPGLSYKFHTLEKDQLKNTSDWGNHLIKEPNGLIHVDTLGYAIHQLRIRGINKIDAYSDNFCTYDAALKDIFFASHRYANDQRKPGVEGRILIAAQLK